MSHKYFSEDEVNRLYADAKSYLIRRENTSGIQEDMPSSERESPLIHSGLRMLSGCAELDIFLSIQQRKPDACARIPGLILMSSEGYLFLISTGSV